MSRQLLDWEKPLVFPYTTLKMQYLLDHGWTLNEAGYSPGWTFHEGQNTYWCSEIDAAFEKQKGMEGVASSKRADMVNNPAHYNKQGIEVIDVIEAYSLGNYHLGNVIKYCCRSGFKGTMLEDWKKARWYLDRLIALEES